MKTGKTTWTGVSVTALMVATLSACGGDDTAGKGTNKNTVPAPVVGSNEKVDAQFVPGNAPRYVMVGDDSRLETGEVRRAVQSSKGAFHSLGNLRMQSDVRVRSLLGNASYAAGRWEGGSYLDGDANTPTKNGGNLHYAVYNPARQLRTNADMTCTGAYTTPTSGSRTARITGRAALTISGITARPSIHLTLTADGRQTSLAVDEVIDTDHPGVFLPGGLERPGAAGIGIAVGDTPDGNALLIAPYRFVLADRTGYSGIAIFSCR